MAASFIRFETRTLPIIAGNQRIVLQARALQIRLPFGGCVWNRPAVVRVRSADGRNCVLMVRDVTRLAQIALLALGIAGSILIGFTMRNSIRR